MRYYKINFAFRLLLVLILLFLTAPTLAFGSQELPVQLPTTATEAVTLLLQFIAAVATVGTFTNLLADVVKKIDAWLKEKWFGRELFDDEQERNLSGWLAEITVLLIAVGLGFAANTWLFPAATYLDSVGAWPVIGTAYMLARNVFYLWRKNAGATL